MKRLAHQSRRRSVMEIARHISGGGPAMRVESRDVRRRARVLIGVSALGLATAAAITAVVLINSAGALMSREAERRAQYGAALLVTVGSDLPDLTPGVLRHGLSSAKLSQLDAAVKLGRRTGLLSDLRVWNSQGKLIYAADEGLERLAPSLSSRDLAQTLRGSPVINRDPAALDLSSNRHTGTLDAFEPLRDAAGRVYGAVETDLPLKPIVAQSGVVRTEILIFDIAGSVLLWMLVLPLTARASLGFARARIPGRRALLQAFQHALDDHEIELAYQPQIDPTDGTMHSLEALVRWRRDGKLQPPGTFMALIEPSSLMTALTDRVIELATAQLAIWRAAGHPLRLSINVSAKDLEDDALASRIHSALARHAIPADQLTVEVTETALLQDIERAQQTLDAISELGVEIAVDDFGTGHASISRLHQFPIQEVKIDRSFVTPTDGRTRAYLAAMVRFGRSLGLRVVAEGVEDAPTVTYLAELKCDLVQGHHIAKPLTVTQIQEWLPGREQLNTAPGAAPTVAV